jgi:hypothetical protein
MMRTRYLAVWALAAILAGMQLFPSADAVAQGNAKAWGTLKGQVVLAGPIPGQKPIPAVQTHQDRKHCEAAGPTVDEDWVVNPKNRGVKWSFVWLNPGPGQKLPIHPNLQAPKRQMVEMDQPCCTFIPHALGMRQGQILVAKNSAPMPHNYKWGGNPTVNEGGNILIPSKGQYVIKDLRADRFPVMVSCTIHPWMKAWVRVFDHPYFAVTDDNGTFEIKDAPAGKCDLVVWHESVGWGPGGKNGREVTIKAGGVTELPKIELKAK